MARSDEYLLELAMEGDAACFGELVNRWQEKIYSFICRYVGNRDEARDLTQDTFTKAYQHLNRLHDPGRFSSWVYKIALNECRMSHRKQRRLRPVPWDDHLDSGRLEVSTETPEKALAGKEMAEALRRAFTHLPAEQRAVIVMKEYQGLKFHEIAEVLEVPLSTVKSRMYLGLKTLRRIMEKRL